jgi:hypothetical protein
LFDLIEKDVDSFCNIAEGKQESWDERGKQVLHQYRKEFVTIGCSKAE